MADANTPEPSIEDILASIRKIISDDDVEDEQHLSVVPPTQLQSSQSIEEDEVLELTDIVSEPVEEVSTVGEVHGSDEPVVDEPTVLYVPEPYQEPSNVTILPQATNMTNETEHKPTNSSQEQDIVSDRAMAAASGAFAKLAHPDEPTKSTSGGKTVEDIARELLRPILREWVDKNLPPLVERLVERELRKISRKAEDL